jgi:hypothetical protein
LDVPDAEGVPLGAQSGPQAVLDDEVVEVLVLEVGAPAAAEDEPLVVELDRGGAVAVPETVEVLEAVVVLEVLWFVVVTVPAAEPLVCPLPELPPQPPPTRTRVSAATISDTNRIRVNRSGLLQALARFAHERDGLGEDDGHHRAQLLGLLLGRPLDVDAVDRRHRQIDGQLDRVVGPGETLRALHLLGELPELALQVIRVTEQAAESTSFHVCHGSHLAAADLKPPHQRRDPPCAAARTRRARPTRSPCSDGLA